MCSKGAVFISDLHLGDVCWAPEKYTMFNDFIDSFVIPYADKLIISGDLLEWVQYEIKSVHDSFDTLKKIFALPSQGIDVYYVVGNHDHDFWRFDSKPLPINVIYPRLHLNIGGVSFHIEHGHFFDPTVSTFPSISEFVVQHGGKMLDTTSPEVEDALGKVKDVFMSVIGKTTGQKKNDEALSEYVKKAYEKAAKDNHDFVIFGHTHKAEVYTLDLTGRVLPNACYVNTGDWQVHYDFAFYRDKQMTTYSWDSQKEEAISFAQSIAKINANSESI